MKNMNNKILFLLLSIVILINLIKGETVLDPTLEDGIYLVHGALCSIPLVGAAIDSVFGLLWNKYYPKPKEKPYVTPEQFKKRLDSLVKDMEEFTLRKIEESIVLTCETQFENIKGAGDNYNEIVTIWKSEMRATNSSSAAVKVNLPVVYYIFLSKMEDALKIFSIESRIHVLAKLYIDTAFLYQSLLHDANYFGVSMGLVPQLVTGTKEVSSYKYKTQLNSLNSLKQYSIFLGKILELKKKINKSIPDWSVVVTTFHYSDLARYDLPVYFVGTSNVTYKFSFLSGSQTLNLNKDDKAIYVVDFAYFGRNITFGVMNKTPFKRHGQSIDFVTNCTGISYDTANGKQVGTYYGDPYDVGGRDHQHSFPAVFTQSFTLKKAIGNQVRFRLYYSYHYLKADTQYIDQIFDFELIDNSKGKRIYKGIYTFEYIPSGQFNDDFKNDVIVPTGSTFSPPTRRVLETKIFNLDSNDISVKIHVKNDFSAHLLSFEVVTY